MIIRVTMKDPDALGDAVADAVRKDIKSLDLPADEREALVEIRSDKAYDEASKWFEYGEYLTVVIDTDAGTCVVEKKG